MKRFGLVPVLVFVIVLMAFSTMAVAPENKARASGSGELVGKCPKPKPESLPPAALSGATRAALSEAPGLYPRMNTKGRYVESAYRGMSAPVNSFYKNACPRRLQDGSFYRSGAFR